MDIIKFRQAKPIVTAIDENSSLKNNVMVCKPTPSSQVESLVNFAGMLQVYNAEIRAAVLKVMFESAEEYCNEMHGRLMKKLEEV